MFFYHRKELRLSLIPLLLLLGKLQSVSASSQPSLDIAKREFRLLGLIISTFQEMPTSEQFVEIEGDIVTVETVLDRLVEVEAMMSDAHHDLKMDTSSLVEDLVEKGEFHLPEMLINHSEKEELLLVRAMAHYYIIHFQKVETWKLKKRDYASILQSDLSGRRIAEFVRVLLEENPQIGLPPFIEETLIEMMSQGSTAYSMVISVLIKHGRVENACRLFCIAGERKSVWISQSLRNQLLFVLEKIEESERLSKEYKTMMKGT